jgi:hypothetical protein
MRAEGGPVSVIDYATPRIKMAQIAIEFTEEQTRLLEEEALRRGVSLEELIRAQALALLDTREREFEAALEDVLTRNRELYRRLA